VGFIENSCTQRISVPPSAGSKYHSMFMNSNGPVSMRCALTECVSGSTVRSETQVHTVPSYSGSGDVVSRNCVVLPRRSRISEFAYSVNSFGQFSTSFSSSQTTSSGASITIELSVLAAMLTPPVPADGG